METLPCNEGRLPSKAGRRRAAAAADGAKPWEDST